MTPMTPISSQIWDMKYRLKTAAGDAVDDHGRTALHYAAGYGEVAAVRALCEAGSDVNAADRTGMTPLHWACLKAHAPVVELLLNSKADAFVSATAGIFKGRCALDLADHAQSDAVRIDVGELAITDALADLARNQVCKKERLGHPLCVTSDMG